MSIKKVHDNQPKEFKFSKENLKKVEEILKRYPEKNRKSAVMPLLYLAQRQNDNWIPLAAMKHIAKFLAMPYISVYEVATFYTMYNLAPVGKHFIQVCTTTPCLLRGADKIVKLCKENISPNENEISKKGNCSWMEVECLGACVSAPMVQINDDYYEDLDEKSTKEILISLINDKPLKPGSYRGRKNTSPEKILINTLFTYSYPPKKDLSKGDFLKLKLNWLVKNNKINLIEEFLNMNLDFSGKSNLIKFLVDHYIASGDISSSCDKADHISKNIKDNYLDKFRIYCLIFNNKKS